jgi:DNA invertase Pin-like site-specific DNA recombinase
MGNPTGARIGYARVSTHDQNPDSQRDALDESGCIKVFTDKASGKLAKRPELDKALEYLRDCTAPGCRHETAEGHDVLVITRLSRAMRSMHHLLDMVNGVMGKDGERHGGLKQRGIGLIVLKQGIDTTTPQGRLVFHIMAAIDEFQRELIVEGTHEGLAAARLRGRKGGRKPKLSDDQKRLAREMYDKRDRTVDQIGAALGGVSRQTVYRALGTAQ